MQHPRYALLRIHLPRNRLNRGPTTCLAPQPSSASRLRGSAIYLTCGWAAPVSKGGCTGPTSLLTLRPNHTAPTTVPIRISIPLSPTRYWLTTTGEEATVNAPRVPQAALCAECAMEAGHTLPVHILR